MREQMVGGAMGKGRNGQRVATLLRVKYLSLTIYNNSAQSVLANFEANILWLMYAIVQVI